MKIEVTQQQRDNALDALHNMWPSVPPENVFPDLGDWRDAESDAKPSCKTVACFGGWCAWWPAFRRQGVRTFASGAPRPIGGGFSSDVALRLFGSAGLFTRRGMFNADRGFRGTDHELVTNRLHWLIENSTVVEPSKPRKTASGS